MDECLYYYPLSETTLGGACITLTCFASALFSQYSLFSQFCIFQQDGKKLHLHHILPPYSDYETKQTKHSHAEKNLQLAFPACLLKLQRKAGWRFWPVTPALHQLPLGTLQTHLGTAWAHPPAGPLAVWAYSHSHLCLGCPEEWTAFWDMPWMAGSALEPEIALLQHRHTQHHCLATGICWLESKEAPWCLINFGSNLDNFIPDYLFLTITTPVSSSNGGSYLTHFYWIWSVGWAGNQSWAELVRLRSLGAKETANTTLCVHIPLTPWKQG